MITSSEITAILKTIIDPELGHNLVDLGLIYDIQINDPTIQRSNDPTIIVTMTLTSPSCPLAPVFIDQIQQTISSATHLNPDQITVNLVFDPPWTPAVASEAVRFDFGI